MRNLKDIERSNTAKGTVNITHQKTLNLSQLHMIFQRDGEDGLRAEFSQKGFEGQAKVSSTKQFLDLLFLNVWIIFLHMKNMMKNDIVTN